jgi:AcrR family transcriptional regulator
MSQPPSTGTPPDRTAKARPRAAKPPKPRGRTVSAEPRAPDPRPRGAARDALLAAARAEFDEAGFEATDTNRIARRAGYAPQTFYRHFTDKTAIFVEIYRRWLEDELQDLGKAGARSADEAARILLGHHARHREFRRSLRRLTTSNPVVRAARAASRRHQLELLEAGDSARGRSRATTTRIALLLCIERLADAAADGELADLGLTPDDEVAMLADLIRRLR